MAKTKKTQNSTQVPEMKTGGNVTVDEPLKQVLADAAEPMVAAVVPVVEVAAVVAAVDVDVDVAVAADVPVVEVVNAAAGDAKVGGAKKASTKKPKKEATKKEATKKEATKKGSKKESTKKATKKVAEKKVPVEKTSTKKAVKKSTKRATKTLDASVPVVDGAEEESAGHRYFKLVYNGEVSGRFSGSKPKQAANKALTAIVKANPQDVNVEGNQNFTFQIRECTRGSRQKEYKYEGFRTKLDKPVEIPIKGNPEKGEAGKTITYNFKNIVKKAKVTV